MKQVVHNEPANINDDDRHNDCVLVRVPKRLRDNWTIYKTNDRRHRLAACPYAPEPSIS